MKCTLTQASVLPALQSINHIPSKSAMPILNNVKLELSAGKLRLTSSNLDMYCTTEISVDSQKDGSITIPKEKFFKIVKELPGPDISLELKNETDLVIKSQKAKFILKGLLATDYPPLPSVSEERSFKIKAQALKKAFTRVDYAASTDATRLVLNGVYLEFSNNLLTSVATDGRRLCVQEETLDNSTTQEETTCIIPSSFFSTLHNNLPSTEEEVTVTVDRTYLAVETPTTRMFTKLLDGTFPNFRNVIPSNKNFDVNWDTASVSQSLKRMLVLVALDASVHIQFDDNAMELTCASENMDTARDILTVEGEKQEAAYCFNTKYLQQAVQSAKDVETITASFVNPSSPMVLKTEDGYTSVLMPMRPK